MIPRLYYRNRGCTMTCWKTVRWGSNDSETPCAAWQSIVPPHSGTVDTNHGHQTPAKYSFATFSGNIWALAKHFIRCRFQRCSGAHERLQSWVSSSITMSDEATRPSMISPDHEHLNQVSCRLALRTLFPSLLRSATALLAGYAAFASCPVRSMDDSLVSRTLLKFEGLIPAGAQRRCLAQRTFISYCSFCATGSRHDQVQTRSDPTSTQEI